jgi:hypothetical protein
MWSRSIPTRDDENERGDSQDAGKTEEIATAGNKLYDSVSGPLTVAVYECAAEGVSDEERANGRLGESASGEACRFEIRVNGEPVATVSSQMEAEQAIRRIAEQGVEQGQETGASATSPDEPDAPTPPTETIAMTPARAADLAADAAIAHESLTAARLLLATDRVGDETGHTVDGYLAGAQESSRRLYSALTTARGVRPAVPEGGGSRTGTREAEWRRLLCLLEQAQEVADRISDDDSARQARAIGDMALRIRTKLNEFTGG